MDKKKILFIDDEETFVQAVKINLEETGKYEVRTETNGLQALSIIREFKPDLILLDIVMPNITGAEIGEQLASDESLKNIPVIFLTAIIKKEEIASSNGVISGRKFIAKPITTEALIACIEKTIKKEEA